MTGKKRWDARLLSLLVFVVAIINMLSAISPAVPERLHAIREILPLFLVRGSRHLVVLAAFCLVLVARGLLRRKRTAWLLAVILLLTSVVTHLTKGLDFEEATVAVVAVVIMLMMAPRFRAKSDVPTIRGAFLLLVAIVVLNVAYGVAGFYLLRRSLFVADGTWRCLTETLTIMFTSKTLSCLPVTRHARWFLRSLWMMWELGLAIFVVALLRPAIYRGSTWWKDREKAGLIAQRHGRSSLVYFTLWNDKTYYFTESDRSYIAYKQVGDVAVALGDPVGPPEEIGQAISGFVEFCELNGWDPAFYQVLPENIHHYRSLGLRCLHIGDEAIVHLNAFDLSGRKFKALRNTCHRLEREGYRAVWYSPPLSDALVRSLKEVSDDWLLYQGGEEKAFSLGWFDERNLKENTVVTIEDSEGKIYAFANFVPMFTLSQASPDMMRYSREAPTGTMDYLFVQSLLHFKEMGIEGFNLGLAPLAHVGQEESSTVAEKAVAFLYENFYNFKGLYSFKEKYGPRWEPRYLVYPNLVALPRVALAVVRAGNPSGYAKFARWALMRLSKR